MVKAGIDLVKLKFKPGFKENPLLQTDKHFKYSVNIPCHYLIFWHGELDNSDYYSINLDN